MRAGGTHIALVFVSLLTVGCATQPLTDLQPGEKPSIESDEAGFWMQMERVEEKVRTSGRVVRDPALNAYLREVLCGLAADYCDDIRIYIVRHSYFNASMAPNGTMQVWTGLLLRVQNEAQLAAVLGHELTHYLRRHTLARWRDIRAKTDALVFFQLATIFAGVGIIGSVAALATYGSIQSFSRDNERESDRLGLDMMVRAGYDPNEAPKVWQMMIDEKEASSLPKGSVFYASHPTSEERRETLAQLAAEADGGEAKTGRERFTAMIAGFRGGWLRDELRQRDFGGLQVVLDRLKEAKARPGQIDYFQGELYRLRGDEEEDDLAKAIASYKTAIASGDGPAEAHRALGLVYWSMERREEAKPAFADYLEAAPAADDRAMIEYYLQQVQ